MLLDLFGRFRRPRQKAERSDRLGHGRNRTSHSTHTRQEIPTAGEAHRGAQNPSGFFSNASGSVFNQPTMIDLSGAHNTVFQNIVNGTTVLDRLLPYIDPNAAVDSSARRPPPLCHPGTRIEIGNRLETWLNNQKRQWNMIWLHGPAGTGKSAVVQTFAELCVEKGQLGAAFFFSRLNHRDDPDRVIPTLAYQLAVYSEEYKDLLTKQVASDPTILRKTPRVQLRRLIVEPLSTLQMLGRPSVQKPFLIALDGLDECDGMDAQCEIVEMIGEVVRLKKDLPLLWLISSRPEAHLKSVFSESDFSIECGREELIIDAQCRDDVDLYLRDGFKKIKAKFRDVTGSSWPSTEQFDKVSRGASGLFALASTGLNYVSDPAIANPVEQLDTLISFLEHAEEMGAKNPLAALDLLYTRILADVSDEVFLTTWRIFSHVIHRPRPCYGPDDPLSAQALCNFLCLSRSAFYGALHKLHSVVDVPPPEEAAKTPLRFYHASFQDFLLDGNRSRRFVVEKQKAWCDIAKTCLFWYNLDLTLFHANDGWGFDYEHEHGSLPDLKWVSADNQKKISREIAGFLDRRCWTACSRIPGNGDQELLPRIHEFDFRYTRDLHGLVWLANWLYEQDCSGTILRTDPTDEVDFRLLEYLRIVVKQECVEPAAFPLGVADKDTRRMEYFFIGCGPKSLIVWLVEVNNTWRCFALNSDKEPSDQWISEHRDWLVKDGWYGDASENETEQEEGEEESGTEDEDSKGSWELQRPRKRMRI